MTKKMKQLKVTQRITNRESVSLEKYLQEIGREEMITAQEETELARRIHGGDHEAMEKLVRANLRFVVSVAKQYQNLGLELSDLINEGNLGLIHAAGKFDETRGFKFISYAVWWIRQSILQALADQVHMVRRPASQTGMVNRINTAIAGFEQEYGRRPSDWELEEKLDIPADRIDDAMQSGAHTISVDAPFGDDRNSSLLDMMADDSSMTDGTLMDESLSTDVERALTVLSGREREIILMYFGIGRRESTLDEIGASLGLTRERVRQIRERAIRRLRHDSCATIREYIG